MACTAYIRPFTSTSSFTNTTGWTRIFVKWTGTVFVRFEEGKFIFLWRGYERVIRIEVNDFDIAKEITDELLLEMRGKERNSLEWVAWEKVAFVGENVKALENSILLNTSDSQIKSTVKPNYLETTRASWGSCSLGRLGRATSTYILSSELMVKLSSLNS